ncbi:hypothetical protein [Nonomuraea sediminis]|uniref:hypothetical protein n=1 Tax=Nonomuraea sediminis TaxID=2835864 RepID=UPI001BDC99A4|nr:hypothetical protein [Nonomuraea sediminis]
MIEGEPRVLYPEFMRQRRRLVERLSVPRRRLWMWLSLVRATPILATMVGESDRVELIFSALSQSRTNEAALRSIFIGLSKRIGAGTVERVAGDLELKDIGWLWAQAVESAVCGSRADSIDSMSYATERIFDGLLVVDTAFGVPLVDGLAMAEDIAWFEDSVQFAELGDEARVLALDRCRAGFNSVMDLCARSEVRLALENAVQTR